MSQSEPSRTAAPSASLPWWQPVLFGALAGGMGWGIRGQYGHETGAMIAGALVGLTFALLFCAQAPLLNSVRAVAWFTVAIGFGGSMTYGQTIGLTHDQPLVGHWDAWRWGMLGLALKGGIWIGFGAVFLGMGLGGARYQSKELLLIMAGLLGLFLAGKWLLNEPFDPAHRLLPRFYFSDAWRWEPGADLKPRREVWGGLLLALAGLLAYVRVGRKDVLALRLGCWGVLGGALGFPLGQCLQSYHAWNREAFQTGVWSGIDPFINWWNMMETTFGAVMGAALGLGLWLNRRRVLASVAESSPVWMKPGLEWALVVGHVSLLILGEFMSPGFLGPVVDLGLAMGVIPVVAIAGGRWWPFLLLLPITLIPIAGKTVRQVCYKEPVLSEWIGWLIYAVIPVAIMLAAAWRGVQQQKMARPNPGAIFLSGALLLCTWIYFGLNFAFFHFPWVWGPWTTRTPNGIIYTGCALGLSWLALRGLLQARRARARPP